MRLILPGNCLSERGSGRYSKVLETLVQYINLFPPMQSASSDTWLKNPARSLCSALKWKHQGFPTLGNQMRKNIPSPGRGSGGAVMKWQKLQLWTQNRSQSLLLPTSLPSTKCLFSAASVFKSALSYSFLSVTSRFAWIKLILSASFQKDGKWRTHCEELAHWVVALGYSFLGFLSPKYLLICSVPPSPLKFTNEIHLESNLIQCCLSSATNHLSVLTAIYIYLDLYNALKKPLSQASEEPLPYISQCAVTPLQQSTCVSPLNWWRGVKTGGASLGCTSVCSLLHSPKVIFKLRSPNPIQHNP